MVLNETAAAYGLFQCAFAMLEDDLNDTLAVLLPFLDKPGEKPNRLTFGRCRKLLCKALDHLKAKHNLSDVRAMQSVEAAVFEADAIGAWRNPRLHARVRLTEQGVMLFDRDTGDALEINRDECLRMISKAIRISVELEAHALHLIDAVRIGERLDALLPDERADEA